MKTLLFIHGGEVWENENAFLNYLQTCNIDNPFYEKIKKWRDDFFHNLKKEGWNIIFPDMPCKDNAKYEYWKIKFEKYLKFANERTVFVGHSLGASFLIQYFQKSEGFRFSQLHLVAPAYNLNLRGFYHDEDYSKLERQFDEIFIYHSKDDAVVPFSDSEKLSARINKSKFIQYENKNHFFDERSLEIEKYII